MSAFTIHAKRGRARRGTIETAHGPVETPAYVPCATHGTVKGIAPSELEGLGFELILSNIYHLYLRPGIERIEELGGIHTFMGWHPSTSSGQVPSTSSGGTRAIFTDSGGFQAFALGQRIGEKSTSEERVGNTSEVGRTTRQSGTTPSVGSPTSEEPRYTSEEGRVTRQPLVRTTEEGIAFRSHIDGSQHFFTPEDVVNYQRRLGVDIATCLDVCTGFPETEAKVGWAVDVTNRWAERSIRANGGQRSQSEKPRRRDHLSSVSSEVHLTSEGDGAPRAILLYGMVQGSIYPKLRERSATFLRELPFDGFAIGGNMYTFGAPLRELAAEKPKMWAMLDLLDDLLPPDQPRHLLGVGEPADIIEGVRHGIDTFDCVMATRMARNGAIWRWQPLRIQNSKFKIQNSSLTRVVLGGDERAYERVNLATARFADDARPLAEDCVCPACTSGLSRAWFNHAFKVGETLGMRLATLHNLSFLQGIIGELRKEIESGRGQLT